MIGGTPKDIPVVNDPAGPARPVRAIWYVIRHGILASIVEQETYLICVDHGMYIVPLFDFYNTKDIVDTQLLQPFHWKRRGKCGQEHAILRERLKDMLR
jgi:hypothetical protein